VLDIRLLRESPDTVKAALARRDPGLGELVEQVSALDVRRRSLLGEVEDLKAQRNRQSAEVARRKKAGEEPTDLLGELKELSARIKILDEETRTVDAELESNQLQLPNLPMDDVPMMMAFLNLLL